MPNNETFISVDVETAGPNPGQYSLLSIGACLVFKPQEQFYVEIQPLSESATAEALNISKLDMAELKKSGLDPQAALTRFYRWIRSVALNETQPVFVAFNAPFDWMFVNDYFHRYLGENPFGHKALDIKAYFMGMTGVSWHETGMRYLAKRYLNNQSLSHHALQDALDQAEIARKMLAESDRNRF